MISVKQSNTRKCTCRGGSNDPVDEQEEQVLSEIEENKQNDFLDPQFSETYDLLRDTLDKLIQMSTINKVLGPWDNSEEVKSIIPKSANSKSTEVNFQRQNQKAKFAVQTIAMIKDVQVFI